MNANRLIAFLGVITLVAGMPAAHASVPVPELFTPAALPAGTALPPDLDRELEAHAVHINWTQLAPGLPAGRVVTVTPTADRSYAVELTACDVRSPESFTWHGRVQGRPDSCFILTCFRDAAALYFDVPQSGFYSLRCLGTAGGEHLLCRDNTALPYRCGVHDDHHVPAIPIPSGQQTRTITWIGAAIVYNSTVRGLSGGTNGTQARCQNCIDITNDCHNNSGTNVQFYLSTAQEISFSESNTYSDMLSRFRDDPTVRGIRDDSVADVISLLTSRLESSGGGFTVGIAYLDQTPLDSCANTDWAYSVCNYLSATDSSLAFPHETGHNLGGGHGNGDGDGCFSDSNGYRFSINAISYYTVMAYDETGGFRTHVRNFSNPSVNYTGTFGSTHATGDSTHNNASTIRATAGYLSSYRAERSSCYADAAHTGASDGDSGCPFATFARGVQYTITNGTLNLTGGSYPGAVTISMPMIITTVPVTGSAAVGVP
jgi:hypothetical protein